MRLLRYLLPLAAAATLAACASTGSASAARSDRNVITAAELANDRTRTLDDVIRQRRPQWLIRRGATSVRDEGDVVVYQDGVALGGTATLARVPAEIVESVRFLSPAEATTRFGTGHTHGAIVIVTRRQ